MLQTAHSMRRFAYHVVVGPNARGGIAPGRNTRIEPADLLLPYLRSLWPQDALPCLYLHARKLHERFLIVGMHHADDTFQDGVVVAADRLVGSDHVGFIHHRR